MQIELSHGETVEISNGEARVLYGALLERVRQRGAPSAAVKLRSALTWPGETTKVTLDRFETEAVQAFVPSERPVALRKPE
ncbi:MAG TPA: hypothetical protein VE984_08565 [Gaiellaceae bacterium]|nr:hypothetical protein [Gaiellaceae bacterium]